MDKFAFLFHPYDLDILVNRGIKEESIKDKNRRLVERSLRWLPPVRREAALVTSVTGKTVLGEMIMVPLICDQILNMDQQFVLEKTIKAAKLAERTGARIVGLGAYLSPVGRRGALIAKEISIPVTSGTTYTIATAIDATLKAAEDTGINISQARITIVGATGSIGKVCAQALAEKVGQLTLVARNMERLQIQKDKILSMIDRPLGIKCSADIKASVQDADIVVISTNTPDEFLSARDLPPGCVVCDISVPHNISADDAAKSEILIIDGGVVQCPGHVDFDYLALPPGVAYACLSEVMILALEGKFENYSTGGDISYEKVLEIKKLAAKHGFSLAAFKSFGVTVTPAQLERVRRAREQRLALNK